MSIRDQVAHLIAFQELEHLTGQRFSEVELEKMERAAQARGHTLEEALARFLDALRNISQDDLAKIAKSQEPLH
jgi:aminoglycoside phosphotransferase (APT) family kinase protein